MPDEHHNELNDIILNRSERDGTRKKMLIGIGTLVIIAIVIVIILGRMSGSAPLQVAHPEVVTPPVETPMPAPDSANATTVPAAPETTAVAETAPATLSNPVPIDQSDIVVIDETRPETTAAESEPLPAEPAAAPAPKPTPLSAAANHPAPGDIYVQVGSFSRYKPNSTFLDNIKRSGYDYTFYRTVLNGQSTNKVLVGPFASRSDAKARLQDIRRKIEASAFIYTIKP